MMKNSASILFWLLMLATPAHAGNWLEDWEWTGYAAVEHRQFFESGAYTGQHGGTMDPSLVLEPEVYHRTDTDTITARLFFRLDSQDDERTHADIRQLDWVRAQGNWEIRTGISKVFWGVTESRHLVDIINQSDLVEDMDEEEKLGQPMLQIATFQPWGDVRFYYLPYFRERTYPGSEGRLRGPLSIATHRPVYTNSTEAWYPGLALRYKHYIGAWDIGLAHFHGTSREPTLRPLSPGTLTPVYEIIDQSSIDLQYTTGAWLWKLEAIGRAGHGDYFGVATGGFEYTFYGVADSNLDVGLLMEYHRDGRDATAPVTVFNNDLFVGSRIALNDVSDTAFLGGTIIDMNDASQSFFIEASTRLTDHLTVELDARIFTNMDSDQPGYPLRNDDYLQLRLSHYF